MRKAMCKECRARGFQTSLQNLCKRSRPSDVHSGVQSTCEVLEIAIELSCAEVAWHNVSIALKLVSQSVTYIFFCLLGLISCGLPLETVVSLITHL